MFSGMIVAAKQPQAQKFFEANGKSFTAFSASASD